MWKNVLFVAAGGAVGSVLRYLIATNIHKSYPNFAPYGTFIVNVTGCLLIGLLMGWVAAQKLMSPQLQLLLIAGFCGSFTTFSTFAHEANLLAMGADLDPGAVLNVGTGERISLNDLYGAMSEILEAPIAPTYAEERTGDVRHSLADLTRAKELLGYEPRVSWRDGLETTLAWYRERFAGELV